MAFNMKSYAYVVYIFFQWEVIHNSFNEDLLSLEKWNQFLASYSHSYVNDAGNLEPLKHC